MPPAPHNFKQWSKELLAARGGSELCNLIRDAFAGVTLGGGIGLNEAQGLDAGGDPELCARGRAKDEKDDWSRIPDDELDSCHSSLHFFDAEGMRFHMPAFLMWILRGCDGHDMHLVFLHVDDYRRKQFALLSPPQRSAVRAFLLCLLNREDREVDRPEILRALDEYWTDSGAQSGS